MLLGRSTDQLSEDRKVGNPPPFKKDGGSIRYRLGTVRDHMLGLPEFNNTTQARVAVDKRKFGIFSSLLDWEAHAKHDDPWPFLIRPGHSPIDFWESLKLGPELSEADTCQMISLDEYRALCGSSSLSRQLDPKPANPVEENMLMREEFARFLDDVTELRLDVISPARIAQAPFDKIYDSVHLYWIRQILNSTKEQRNSLGVSMMLTLREAYAAKVDAWTIPTGIEMLMNISSKAACESDRYEHPELHYFIRQATDAAFTGDLPTTLSRFGDLVVKPKDFLRWAEKRRLPVDPEVARAIDSKRLGSINFKAKPGRPHDPDLKERGRKWRGAAARMMYADSRINLSAAARKISTDKALAMGYPMETIRKQLTKALMIEDGHNLRP